MSDNLKQVKDKVAVDIDPNGAAESVLVQNHQDILNSFLDKAGKYVGSSFISKKTDTVYSIGTMSWNSNAFNTVGNIVIGFSKNNSDNIDFGKTLSRMNDGDIIVFKDFVGRVAYLEYKSHSLNTSGTNDFYEVTVLPDADNSNYTYQDLEEETCVISVILQASSLGGSEEKITIEGVEYVYRNRTALGTLLVPVKFDIAEYGVRTITEEGLPVSFMQTLSYNVGDPSLLSSWEIISEVQV